jgi:glycosyltransferase involved in cell wall biosynthesis
MEVMLRASKAAWDDGNIHAEILAADNTAGPYANELRNAGYDVHHFGFSKTLMHFWQYFQFLRKRKYDVVHIHLERAMVYYGVLARCAGVPCIIRTIHSNFQFSGMLRLRRRWQRWLLRRLGVTFVSISPSVSATEREYFRNPTVLIPNWFDASRFLPSTASQRHEARRKLSISSDQVAVITIGNCAAVKNHCMLLEALADIISRGVPVVYIHIGLEEQSMSERKLAASLGIGQQVHFLGWIENPVEYLYAVDLYVMCSTQEGFGIAALEAMACGVPVVLTNVPGLRDFREVAQGVIWADPTCSSISNAIESASRLSVTERSHLGSQMSSSVHRQFCPDAGISAYAALYRRHSLPKTTIIPVLTEGA